MKSLTITPSILKLCSILSIICWQITSLAFAASKIDSATDIQTNTAKPNTLDWQHHDHIDVALVHQVKHDNTVNVGIVFKPAKDWHVYWKNAGDTGLPTKIQWQAEHLSFSELHWPFPEAIPFSHLINYGYHGQTLIYSQAQIDSSAEQNIDLNAKVEWLVCKDSCVPGDATFHTTIPLKQKALKQKEASATSQAKQLFQTAAQQIPRPIELMGQRFTLENNKIKLEAYAKSLIFKDAKSVDVFPVQQDIIAYSSPPTTYWKKNLLRWEQDVSEYFSQLPKHLELIIVVDKQRAYQVTLDTKPKST